MNMIKRIPIPFCGVALALVALGNLFQSSCPSIRPVLGLFSACILILFILKVILFFSSFKEDMKNPVQASVSGTFSMACMLLSVYIKPVSPMIGKSLWVTALFLHIVLILYFSIHFLRRMKAAEYHASFYIVYVGIAVASISSPAWDMQILGKGIAVFALAAFLVLVLPITMRYQKDQAIPLGLQPLFSISAAPASLCIVALKNSFGSPWRPLLFLLFILGTILYIPALMMAVKKVCDTFYPSFAAFTFPMVISAIATGTMQGLFSEQEPSMWAKFLELVIRYWFLFQKILAVIMTLFVLNRFIYRLFLYREGEQ